MIQMNNDWLYEIVDDNADEEFIEDISSKSELTIVWEKDGKS